MVKDAGRDEAPWSAVELTAIERHGKPDAMLRAEEKQYLYWLMRDAYEGLGSVVDLGPLTGGSTVCLAGGGIDNRRLQGKTPIIESYDLFWYDGTWGDLSRRGIKKGDDFFAVYLESIAKVRAHVSPVKGDIMDIKSYAADIELLFVDLAKSENLMAHVMKTFFPKVLVGSGAVVHQDYKFVGMPYLKAFQEAFSDYFEIMPFPADVPTVAFRLVKALPSDFSARVDQLIPMGQPERTALLVAARNRFAGSEWHIMNASLVGYLCSRHAFADAADRLAERISDGCINGTAANFYQRAILAHPAAEQLTAELARQKRLA